MIEDVIRKLISETPNIARCLAQYKFVPAVFYQTPPVDIDPEWGEEQYPRIDYNVEWSYNAERKTAGIMTLDLWCLNESAIAPEDLGKVISTELSEVFVADETGIFCIVWNRTDSFVAEGNEPQTVGVTVSFDVLEFPLNIPSETDPIVSCNQWAKALFPTAIVIGIDEMQPIMRPSNDTPVLYFRTASMTDAGRTTYAVAWMNATIVGHVIAPTPEARYTLLKRMSEELAINGEILMNDNSPMMINKVSYTTSANPLINGQLTVSGTYGVLRQHQEYTPLTNIKFSRQEG